MNLKVQNVFSSFVETIYKLWLWSVNRQLFKIRDKQVFFLFVCFLRCTVEEKEKGDKRTLCTGGSWSRKTIKEPTHVINMKYYPNVVLSLLSWVWGKYSSENENRWKFAMLWNLKNVATEALFYVCNI